MRSRVQKSVFARLGTADRARQTAQPDALLRKNTELTELTELTRDLTERIELLTRDVHDTLTRERGEKSAHGTTAVK
jgi:hypothetical protein